MKILAGDVGGTKVLLQLCDVGASTRVIATKNYSSCAYEGLDRIVTEFLDEAATDDAQPSAACFAVAGPVRGRKAKITNLPWMLDADQLAVQLHVDHVHLINDMQGVGHGIDGLDVNELEVLQAGELNPRGPRAILAAGTGLGQGAMVWQEDRYVTLASEGGHADFAPRDDLEIALLQFLLARRGQVSCESLVSGRGLVHIYEFLRDTGHAEEPASLAEELRNSDDPAAVISARALAADGPPIAQLALERFVRIYGAVAGNLALTFLATGGVYIAGGIVLKIMDAMRTGAFIEAFRRNVAMQSLLERVPVYIVPAPDVCLLGARHVALRLLESAADAGSG
jgi:glucokinase